MSFLNRLLGKAETTARSASRGAASGRGMRRATPAPAGGRMSSRRATTAPAPRRFGKRTASAPAPVGGGLGRWIGSLTHRH